MNDRDREVYSKSVRTKLDALEAKKYAAELKARDIGRQIEELIVGQSAIGVGDRITWASRGNVRARYGRVLSIRSFYHGFEYRVAITTKDGKRDIGTGTVNEHDQPELLV